MEAATSQELERIEAVWPSVSSLLFVPHTEAEYERLVALLDDLIGTVGEDENRPLASLMDVLIEKHEDDHVA